MRLPEKLFVLAFVCCLPVCLSPTSVRAAAGDLDPTYGSGGKVTADFFGTADVIRDAAVQPDGKVVVVGDGHGADGVERSGLTRYRLDGSPDAAFGSDGRVTNRQKFRPRPL